LQAAIKAEGQNFTLAAWDWRYYAEKVRKTDFNVNEADVKPYLSLERMIDASFDCATRLFGLSFREVKGQTLYHPEVRLWEVTRGAKLIGHFLGDYFARPTKHSGAWMSSFRSQHKLEQEALGGVRPLIINVLNFAKAPDGQPTLLSLDDARTLFHEFGHGLHGLLSDVTYPSVSGTSVSRDFVELPSQLYEAWLMSDHVLQNYALHIETGEPMPKDLVARLKKARNFNMGFATVEYLASALVDLDLHTREAVGDLDVEAAERETLERIGMPAEISMRHRTPHFQHILGGYAAGYYAYLWSEVLDADAFRAFEETGNVFDPAMAKRLHDNIYSAGGRQEPEDAYTGFRGRLPSIDALLEKRGFKAAA
jgi:peptidyl-dipeptidase Dcp